MNWDIVEGNWKQLRGLVKTQWGRLINDQLDVISGKRTHLSGKIQASYGAGRDKSQEQLRKFKGRNRNHQPAKSAW